MQSLGTQFEEKMMRRVEQDQFDSVAEEFSEDLLDGAKERSLRGESLPGGRWDNVYGRTQASKHGRKSPVTLRDTDSSMRGMNTQKKGRGASIRGNQKMEWHDRGAAKGGKIRQLFPRTPEQVPPETMQRLIASIKSVLDGKRLN